MNAAASPAPRRRARVRAPELIGKGGWLNTGGRSLTLADLRGKCVVVDFCTFTNIATGELVRWLPRRQTTDLALPGTDFWLFDSAQALFHHFTGNGQLDQDGREYADDPERVKLCAGAFEAAWQRAVPHEEYRPR
ncbi:DUF6879 family protein [Streptomyces spongiicola]|uniref:DUF6879 family protein n=1 Tax=Streptomyces spongiicola TaxID=1690221 RepID=UPI00157FA70C|nr:DUF6879 family protein [Streptomyces spongiicola]